MLIVLGILQLALPQSITGAVYIDGKKLECTKEECKWINSTKHCETVKIECPSQGPFSMFQQIYHHPLLLMNGVLNIAYYTGETMLYREPLGLIFLVLASLTSTFLINPLNLMFDQPIDQNIPAPVLVLGIAGAILCVIERKPKEEIKLEESERKIKEGTIESEYEVVAVEGSTNLNEPLLPHPISTKERVKKLFWASLRIFVPFLLLSVTYAMWFVIQKFIDNDYHVNAFSYNSLDQGLLPLYILPWLLLVDYIKPLKKCYEDPENQDESFRQSLVTTWKEASIFDLFFYRLFINGRAFAYFVLTVNYNLTIVYLELTLIRVILSWIGAIIVTLLIPRFIGTTPEEKKAVFSPINIVLKTIGTIAITGSLILLNQVYK